MKKRILGVAFGVAMLFAGGMSFNVGEALAQKQLVEIGSKCGTYGIVGNIHLCRGACKDCVIVIP